MECYLFGTHALFLVAGLGFSAGYLPCALLLVVWARQWALLLPLLMGVVGFVLSLASHYERRVVEPPEPLPTPKPAGMPAHTRLPAGWIPVYVHRPGGRFRDMLVDYRVHVEGARVGELAPGQTLLIGLGAGAHRVQGRLAGGSSPNLNLWLSEGHPVHLVLEPNGSDLEAVAQVFSPNTYLRLAHREAPRVGFENGAQGPYP